jgi:phosphoglycolate phosphatase-like HAD superfamily hydrolase
VLRAHIIVTGDMDVAGELQKLQRLAHRNRLDTVESSLMLEHVSSLIDNVQETLSELKASGISTGIKRIASSDNYQVTLEARQGRSGKTTSRSLLSFLRR